MSIRIGIDLGGTKIEGRAFDAHGQEIDRLRVPTPREDYSGTIDAIVDVARSLEVRAGEQGTVGVGIPGSVVRSTGLVKNANSTWLNGRAIEVDLTKRMGREVRCANDANCLAVSEATDGAGAGYGVVFGVIVGTGCGGGISINGRVHNGPNGLAGEWGHNPLPRQTEAEWPGPVCYCGRLSCIEMWCCGTGLERDFRTVTGRVMRGPEIVAASEAGDADAEAAIVRLEDRLAKSLATIYNSLDPDCIVLGGGLSQLDRLYTNLPPLISTYTFGGPVETPIKKAVHGDASGVRGAAWLWPAATD
ncbi:transcriptional regulator/sugar kinase [Terriglobus roseus DSM 18391]|uniref:Transcriptional regulator/sugar kinase n=1 Tax=Terriglobus roseus (strain DSM 18391 / NRRL B-41598 / KBS 63) TaxID=926566 RepID=I3ZEM2_TERRK|nr:ROK family protein [Terriglobus roseus]AFL87690.1 transcriptional regulator/sugar kinase [Terriglobus roseus DSM 18391]